MIPYYILITLPVIPLLSKFKVIKIGKKLSVSTKVLSISIFFIILFFLVSLRADVVGNDTKNYIYYFNLYGKTNWDKLFVVEEPAYAVLNKLVSIFSSNATVFFSVAAFIYIVPLVKLYIDNIEFPMLTIALFITMSTFVMLFSGVRQSIAIALGVIGFYFTKNKKLLPFVFVVLLAMLFHRSAFMIVFMYPLYHLKITKNWFLFVVPIIIMVFVFNKPIFSFLSNFISDSFEVNISSTGAYMMIILFALLTIFSYLVVDEEKMDSTTLGFRNFLLMSTTIQMFAPVNTLAMRMNYYYIVFIPLLIPKIIKLSSMRFKQISTKVGCLMILFFIIYFCISAPKSNTLHTFPYLFFWEAT